MLPAEAEAVIAAIGAAADGVVVLSEARQELLGRHVLAHHEAHGRLIRLGRGVWRLRDHPFDFRCRCRAALALAGPGAVLGLRTAARLHGFWAYRDSDVVEVLVPRGRDHRTVVGRLVQTRWLPPSHTTVVAGLPITTMSRTFFDLCGDPDHGLPLRHPHHERRMREVYNDCLGRRGMTFTMAVEVLSIMARRGRAGTRLVRKILRCYGPRHKPTKSDLETMFFDLAMARGLPEPERQAVISDAFGFIGTVDFAWRSAMHIVEVDSSWHDGPLDEEVDEGRDKELEDAGYTITRYRYGDIVLEPERVIRELGAALRAMTGTAAPRTVG